MSWLCFLSLLELRRIGQCDCKLEDASDRHLATHISTLSHASAPCYTPQHLATTPPCHATQHLDCPLSTSPPRHSPHQLVTSTPFSDTFQLFFLLGTLVHAVRPQVKRKTETEMLRDAGDCHMLTTLVCLLRCTACVVVV